jgi:hypothetical protein
VKKRKAGIIGEKEKCVTPEEEYKGHILDLSQL